MKKKSKNMPKVDPYLESIVSKLVERLESLEKKMDTLIRQTAGKGQPSASNPAPQIQQPPRKERTLYEAICADCSNVCEVPFRPSEDRPVYCKTCFAKRKGGGHGMPILRPVTLLPKPVGKLGMPVMPSTESGTSKKAKKSPAKKGKKKK